MAPVRFGSVTVRLWNGSSGSGFRFRRFHWRRVFQCFSTDYQRGTVPVPLLVPGKTVPTVPVSGSGSVPGPSCITEISPN